MATENIDIRVSDNGSSRVVSRNIEGIGRSASGALTAIKLLTVGLAGLAIFKVTKDAIAFESALVGVQKTTGLTDAKMRELGKEFQQLSRTIPLTSTELAKIGEVAGQLGITGVDNIATFTDTVAKVASTTDFTVESAASDLARLSSLFEVPINEVGRLASAMNALENSTTANAPTIAEFSKRMAGAGTTIGLTGAEITAVAATLDRLGAQAEAGSSVMTRAFGAMISKADEFASIMGTTTEQFRADLEENAIGTVSQFLTVLGQMSKTDAVAALDNLGLSGVRALPIFLKLKDNVALLTQNVNTATKAFEEGTAVEDEFATQVRSTENQIKLLRNEITVASQQIGAGLLPVVRSAIEVAKQWVTELNENEFRLRNMGAFIGGTLADLVNLAVDAFNALRAAMEFVAAVALKVTGNLGLLLVPFANLTDLMGLTTDATKTVLLNLQAMDAAGDKLFDTAVGRVENFKTGVVNTRIEVETTLKKFEELEKKSTGALGTGGGVVGTGTQGPTISQDALDDIVDAGQIAGTDLFLQRLQEIDIALKQNKISADEASRAIQSFSSLNEGAAESGFEDIIPATALTGTDLFIKQLDRVNQAFEQGVISANEASRAIQAFSSNNAGAAGDVQGLAAVLKASETPVDRLNTRLEDVSRLFEEGFIDEEQASNAVRKFTDTYNSEMSRMEKKTDDSSKAIQDAINGLAGSMESRMTDLFTDMIKGTADFEKFFTGLIDEMIAQIIRLAVVKPLISGIFGGIGGFQSGGSFEVPGFATGGGFGVGGVGGADSQFVGFMATPGETVRITTPSQERMMAQGGGTSNVSIVVNISGGTEDVSSEGDDSEKQEFGLQAANVIKSVVLDMMRPGQPLAPIRQVKQDRI